MRFSKKKHNIFCQLFWTKKSKIRKKWVSSNTPESPLLLFSSLTWHRQKCTLKIGKSWFLLMNNLFNTKGKQGILSYRLHWSNWFKHVIKWGWLKVQRYKKAYGKFAVAVSFNDFKRSLINVLWEYCNSLYIYIVDLLFRPQWFRYGNIPRRAVWASPLISDDWIFINLTQNI